MTENTNDLRVTTISLNEYDNLRDNETRLRELVGAKEETISNLRTKISELQDKQPEVKVIHGYKHTYTDDYDGGETTSFDVEKVEFTNLTEVERMANEQAKTEVKDKLETLENETGDLKRSLKYTKEQIESLGEKIEEKDRLIKKNKSVHANELDEEKETYNKNIKKLKTAADQDTAEYKETIKDLKEEIKKIKDNKTDVEVEEKRNKEIKDLKGRIKDLETMIAELSKLNFFKRIWKLRKFTNDALLVHEALLERKENANKVGTTWVKENGKYSKSPNAFENAWNTMTAKLGNAWNGMGNAYYTISNNVFGTSTSTGLPW